MSYGGIRRVALAMMFLSLQTHTAAILKQVTPSVASHCWHVGPTGKKSLAIYGGRGVLAKNELLSKMIFSR